MVSARAGPDRPPSRPQGTLEPIAVLAIARSRGDVHWSKRITTKPALAGLHEAHEDHGESESRD